jgi:hypothetical protein
MQKPTFSAETCACGCGQRVGSGARFAFNHRESTGPAAFWGFVVQLGEDECWPWRGARHEKGYGRFGPRRVHRSMYETFVGPIRDGLHVLHRCDNPPCCNPAHLFLGTNADNVADRVAKGRTRTGTTLRKLTREQVQTLRGMAATGRFTQREIGETFGIAQQTAGKIIRGERYSP